jgi:hypothetical protein
MSQEFSAMKRHDAATLPSRERKANACRHEMRRHRRRRQ